MTRFTLPKWIGAHEIDYVNWRQDVPQRRLDQIKSGLDRFTSTDPLVTISIPVWNEEEGLIRTLSSLSKLKISVPTELLFVNNNSTDDTRAILDYFGVRALDQLKQGIAHARLLGLQKANGKYILNGDGDSLYPPNWISEMVNPLIRHEDITCTYGMHAHTVQKAHERIMWGFYEYTSEVVAHLRRFKREFFNVHGCNFAFRREEGLMVKGFELSQTRRFNSDPSSGDFVIFGEDGRMGRKLGEIGQLKMISSPSSLVWTSPRRLINQDGSIVNSFLKRLKTEVGMLKTYLFGPAKPQFTSDGL